MFKHILIPTDGSRLAAKGVKAGIKLARALGARVTGVKIVLPYMPPIYGEAAVYYPAFSPGDYDRISAKEAKKALGLIEREARAAKVQCTTRIVKQAQPWQGILKAARAAKCDAIVMSTHGRGGIGGLILGSETQHVLARSKIPVVVIR